MSHLMRPPFQEDRFEPGPPEWTCRPFGPTAAKSSSFHEPGAERRGSHWLGRRHDLGKDRRSDLDETQARSHPATAELPAGPYVFLEVRDTGCGIDEATQVKIFDPFFSTKFIGRGLGWRGGRHRARPQGAITVSSVPGQGSCFTVLFPPAARRPETPVPAPEARLSGTGTILVVDDEEVCGPWRRRS